MAVIKTDDREFHRIISEHDRIIVKFYADWCGSCRLFDPKFRRLSEDKTNQGITFLNINAEENPDVRKWAGVSNLPFFATIKNGALVESDTTAKEERVKEMISKLN